MDIEDSSIAEAKQIATHLAIGLLRQEEAIQKGTAYPVTILDEQLQWGWDKLTFFCLKYGVDPPRHLPQLIEWLHQPIEEWGVGQFFTAINLYGSLLNYGMPGELCNELSRDMHLSVNPDIEIHDLSFKQILNYCKTNHLPAQYTLARKFLVENPYFVLVQREMEFWDDEIGHKMDRLIVLVKD